MKDVTMYSLSDILDDLVYCLKNHSSEDTIINCGLTKLTLQSKDEGFEIGTTKWFQKRGVGEYTECVLLSIMGKLVKDKPRVIELQKINASMDLTSLRRQDFEDRFSILLENFKNKKIRINLGYNVDTKQNYQKYSIDHIYENGKLSIILHFPTLHLYLVPFYFQLYSLKLMEYCNTFRVSEGDITVLCNALVVNENNDLPGPESPESWIAFKQDAFWLADSVEKYFYATGK